MIFEGLDLQMLQNGSGQTKDCLSTASWLIDRQLARVWLHVWYQMLKKKLFKHFSMQKRRKTTHQTCSDVLWKHQGESCWMYQGCSLIWHFLYYSKHWTTCSSMNVNGGAFFIKKGTAPKQFIIEHFINIHQFKEQWISMAYLVLFF